MSNYITTYGLNGYFTLPSSVTITSNTLVKFKVTPRGTGPNGMWFGAFENANTHYALFHPNSYFPNTTIRWYFGAIGQEGLCYSAATLDDIMDHPFEVECGYNYIKINDVTTVNYNFRLPIGPNTFYIGTTNVATWDEQQPLDWEYFQIYESGVLVYDLVPSKTNGSLCLKNNVDGSFLMPTGTVSGEVGSFEVEPTEISTTSGGSAYTVNVSADTEVTWTASTSDSWIGLSSSTGTGNGSFTVNIPENPEYAARSGEITVVSSDEGEATISVSQEKKAAIFTRRDIYRSGNQVNKAYRSGDLIYLNLHKYVGPIPYDEQYLTFDILSAGTIVWKTSNSGFTKTIQYSKNAGLTWNDITPTTAGTSFNVVPGDKVLFKGDNSAYSTALNENTFSGSTAIFNVEGNIMSLINSRYFKDLKTISASYCFADLFKNCSGIIDASNLILPATTLSGLYCYDSMFQGCTSLTQAPALPATTLAEYCYQDMFSGCRSLTNAPVLPSTEMKSYCYYQMFYGCTGLTTAPELPATTLAEYCYCCMFQGCTSLTTAPALPATTLAENCYLNMFYGCTGLTQVPELPATTLAGSCYQSMFERCTNLISATTLPATVLANTCYASMFRNCSKLKYIKCLATDITATNCTNSWVSGVSSTGTFVKAASMTGWTSGKNGIPTNWTVEDDTLPYDQQYLTFVITSGGNIYWKTQNASYTKTIEYSKDGGTTWSAITSSTGGVTIPVVSGDTVMFRGDNAQYAPQDGRCSTFTGSTAGIILQGNIMSLVNSTGFTTLKDFTQANVFMNFFNNCKGIESAENLILPATGLTQYCYQGMLANCTNLTRAPKLPAETLATGCYNYLFYQSSKVNYIECLTTTNITSNTYTQEWVRSVQTTSGTFVKKSGTTISQGGSNGIPSNWTIENV